MKRPLVQPRLPTARTKQRLSHRKCVLFVSGPSNSTREEKGCAFVFQMTWDDSKKSSSKSTWTLMTGDLLLNSIAVYCISYIFIAECLAPVETKRRGLRWTNSKPGSCFWNSKLKKMIESINQRPKVYITNTSKHFISYTFLYIFMKHSCTLPRMLCYFSRSNCRRWFKM